MGYMKQYSRKNDPVSFWSMIGFYSAVILAFIGLVLFQTFSH